MVCLWLASGVDLGFAFGNALVQPRQFDGSLFFHISALRPVGRRVELNIAPAVKKPVILLKTQIQDFPSLPGDGTGLNGEVAAFGQFLTAEARGHFSVD